MASSSDSRTEKSGHLSEQRIVILGQNWKNKRSAGNTILGNEEFDTETYTRECMKRQGSVAGREVTVVDTPEWGIWYFVSDPKNLNRMFEDIRSLCPPGPHAFLIVIPVETLRGTEWTVEAALEILPERVWRHTVVLFTSEELSETAIEQLIERERCLQQIVEKCGNRYHVLNTTDRADGTQVTELLQRIEEMVAGNSGAYFLLDEALQELREKRRAAKERGKQRLMKVQKQRETLRALLMGESHHLSELRIVLLGRRGAGLSSTGNTILGREEFDTKTHTTDCVKRQGSVAGRQVTVVDTPGWYMRSGAVETPEQVKKEIKRCVSLFAAEPHALLLVMNGAAPFTETNRRAVEEHLELLSDSVWRHTIVLFTWGDSLKDRSIEQHIESWTALQWLIDKCGNRYHVLNTTDRADGTQVTELLEKIEEMVAGNDLRNISLTKYLESEERNRELKKANEGKEEEISQLKEELNKLQKEKEERTAPVRNIVEIDLYMSGERSPGGTEVLSQEEENRQRDRDRRMQREEEELRAQHQAEQEERERRMREEMRRREESLIKPLEEKIQELEERLRRERDEHKRRELEGELRRQREQRERLEREEERRREEEQKERREREERQRGEMEALRQHYRQEAREDAGRSLNVGAVALGAAIGAIAGALRGPLGAAAGTAIGAVAGGQLGALIRGGQRDGGKRREERRSSTKDSMLSVRRRNSLEFVRPTF